MTLQIKYSFSPITNANFDSATSVITTDYNPKSYDFYSDNLSDGKIKNHDCSYNYLYNRKNNIFDSVNFINKLTPKAIKDFSIDFFLKKNINLFIYGNDIDPSNVAKIINIF